MRHIKIIIACLLVASLAIGISFAQAEKESQNKKATELFKQAKQSIYKKDWRKAIEALKDVADNLRESDFVDDSLYWLGYSLNQLSKELSNIDERLDLQREAIERLNSLTESSALSSFVNDAKMLRIEVAEALVKSGLKDYKLYINGSLEEKGEQAEDADLEMKIVALNALMNMDKEKAFPILEKILRENVSPKLREKAVFILSQSRDNRVVPLMKELAIKDKDQKVKEQAIFWLGQRKDQESLEALFQVYNTATDTKAKDKLIFSISQHRSDRASEKLFDIAKNDKDRHAQGQAIFWLGQRNSDERALDFLVKMYDPALDFEIKDKLIFAYSQRREEKALNKLVEIARSDKESKAREKAVFWLGQKRIDKVVEILAEIYDKTDDSKLKKSILFAISQNKDDKAIIKLIEMARREKDVELKKQIIFWLGQSKSDEALKFLKEIIDK